MDRPARVATSRDTYLGIAWLDVEREESHLVGELPDTELLETRNTFVVIGSVDTGRSLSSWSWSFANMFYQAWRLEKDTWCRALTRSGHLGHVRHNDESTNEIASVTCLRLLHALGSKDDLQAARNAAARQLGLHFLDADFLEVDKLGVVQIEREFLPIGTLRVLAASWLVVSTELITIGQQMVNGQWSGRPLTWVYLNCCWTFLMTVWQSKQVNVPATNSGWTGWVRVT